jgi:hypothetical protein
LQDLGELLEGADQGVVQRRLAHDEPLKGASESFVLGARPVLELHPTLELVLDDAEVAGVEVVQPDVPELMDDGRGVGVIEQAQGHALGVSDRALDELQRPLRDAGSVHRGLEQRLPRLADGLLHLGSDLDAERRQLALLGDDPEPSVE